MPERLRGGGPLPRVHRKQALDLAPQARCTPDALKAGEKKGTLGTLLFLITVRGRLIDFGVRGHPTDA